MLWAVADQSRQLQSGRLQRGRIGHHKRRDSVHLHGVAVEGIQAGVRLNEPGAAVRHESAPTAQAEARLELAASKSMAVKSRQGIIFMLVMCTEETGVRRAGPWLTSPRHRDHARTVGRYFLRGRTCLSLRLKPPRRAFLPRQERDFDRGRTTWQLADANRCSRHGLMGV